MPDDAITVQVIGEEVPEPKEVVLDEEQDDPGQHEGEQRHEPPPGHARFNVIYAKMKDAERKVADLSTQVGEQTEALKTAKEHNQQLASTVERVSTKAVESMDKVANKITTGEEDSALNVLHEQRDQLNADKVIALGEGEYERVAQIDDQLRGLDREILAAEQQPAPAKNPSAQEEHPDITWFKEQAPWFETDAAMRGAAMGYDAKISQDPAWANVAPRDRYTEVKRYVEALFGTQAATPAPNTPAPAPGTPAPPPQANPAQNGAPAVETGVNQGGGGGAMGGGNAIVLTPEQVRTAHMMDMSVEEYAQQLAFIQKGEV